MRSRSAPNAPDDAGAWRNDDPLIATLIGLLKSGTEKQINIQLATMESSE
jgi:hypothetical protein